jgi:MFS family permease
MEDKLLTHDGKLLLSSILLNSIPIGYMNVVPLVYLAEIGYNPSVIGLIYAVSALANAIGLIPMGFLADRHGRKWFLVAGSVIPCASYAVFGLTLDPSWLLFASALGGVGFAGGLAYAMANPAAIPLLAESTSKRNRTTFFGLSQATFTFALSLGALLSVVPGLLIDFLGEDSTVAHSESYFLMSGLMVASVIPLLFFKEKRGNVNRPDDKTSVIAEIRGTGSTWLKTHVTSWPKIAKLSCVFALTGLGVGVIVQLLPTWYALKFGVSEDTVGNWTGLANGVSILIIPIIPRLVKRRGTLISSAVTGMASAGYVALMPIAGSFEGAAALFVVRTLFEAMAWAMLLSYTMGAVPEPERATAVGVTLTAWGIGATGGTYLGGVLLGSGLLYYPFVVCALAYASASIALPIFFRNNSTAEES